MSIPSSSHVRRRAIAAACLGILLLGGCSTHGKDTDTDTGTPTGQTSGQPGEQTPAGDHQDTPAGPRDDIQIGTELPDGFPTNEVPLLEGTIVSAAGTEAEGIWVVMIHVPEAADAAKQQAISLLTAAGYTESEDLPGMNAYTNGDLNVTIRTGQAETGNGTVVNYTINPQT